VHNSYYFLRQVAFKLDTLLKGHQIVSCFSQSRDELMMEFHLDGKHFFIRANLSPELPCVSFPDQLRRARKNSIDLFPGLIFRKVERAHVYENDRSFSIHLEGNHCLLFKMHGNRSNVLHTVDDRVVDLFRKGLVADRNLSPTSLSVKIDWDAASADPRKKLFTFSGEVWSYLKERGFDDQPEEAQRHLLTEVRNTLESPPNYYHVEFRQKLAFSLLPLATTVARFSDPLEAVTAYAAAYLSRHAFDREKSNAMGQLQAAVRKTEAYLHKTRDHFETLKADQHFQAWGDLLMANLDKVSPGSKSVIVANFYEGDTPVEIKIDPRLSPQKNAEVYYRKSRNRSIELKRNQDLLIAKEMELLKLSQLLSRVQASQTLQEIRELSAGVPATKKEQEETKVPYRETTYNGFRIWIGKDAGTNDELTLKYSHKEDLWLHAKDVAGSHVLVKHQSGKKFPKDVIERAAQLAAFYSKRKTDTLCPVAYTSKKFVRKRKGDPAGLVVVERETVILVEPRGV
jgi:predicted ribosome quality control (RQC) complex YloA/Tae2 family protein